MSEKWNLPCGHRIDHYESIRENVIDTKTGMSVQQYRKTPDGKQNVKRHVKGDASFITGSQATCNTCKRTFTFIPGRWVDAKVPKPPDPRLVVE